MRQIEIANPDTLYGVLSMFSAQKWTNKAIWQISRYYRIAAKFQLNPPKNLQKQSLKSTELFKIVSSNLILTDLVMTIFSQ